MGDELQRIVRATEGEIADLTIGPEGRILERSGIPFDYDQVGRRTEDDRFVYLWSWRSELVQATVKDSWPNGEETPFAGHQIRYDYDAAGRLHRRHHLGRLPDGATSDAERPFIERRVFVWENSGLVAEISYGDAAESQVRWRKSYVPGASGYDDAVQVAVEVLDFPGSSYSGSKLYTYLRDEQGTVIGVVAEEESHDAETPSLPVRYLYTPYGEVHAEVGPEVRRARFDAGQSQAWTATGTLQQQAAEGTSGGALRVNLSAALDAATLAEGITVEHLTASGWTEVDAADQLQGFGTEDPTELVILLTAGWQHGGAYRVTLSSDLADTADRPVQGAEPLEWQVPQADTAGTAYEQRFAIHYESYQAAAHTVGGRFPGGQTSLFQGLWTDPVTGQSYARARWYDARNASFLIEDPMADVDSPNLYSFVGWQPNMATDPTGMCSIWETVTNKNKCREYFADSLKENLKEEWEESKETVSVVTSMLPGIGDAKDVLEVVLGVDLVTGRELSLTERGLTAIAAIIPGVGGAALRAGADLAIKKGAREGAERVAKESVQKSTADLAGDGASRVGRQAEHAGTSKIGRQAETCPLNCFGAETLVASENGLVPIEDLQVGDKVFAYDEETGEVELKEVTQLFSRQREEIYVLTIAGEAVHTTNEHPFYVEGEGWTEAEKLQVGDLLQTQDGDSVRLDKIEIEPGGDWVFNFSVEDFSTYFVSDGRVLVHNCSPRSRVPKSKGSWEGTSGESAWRSESPDVISVTGGKPVEFTGGRPDFKPWAKGKVTFNPGALNGTRKDFSLVYEELMSVKGFKTKKEAKAWLKGKGLTPHHQDATTILLVPTKLHANVPHIGAASDLRGGF